MENITYMIDRFDLDGDLVENCVIINLQNGVMLKFENVWKLDNLIKELKECSKQIKENIYED